MVRKISAVVLLILSIIKFLTFSYYLADDPESGLCISPNFSFSNSHLIEDKSHYITILSTENEFIGERVYHFLMSWGWGLALVTVIISLLPLFKRDFHKTLLTFFSLFTGTVWSGILFRLLSSSVNYIGFNYVNLQYVFGLFIFLFMRKLFVGKTLRRSDYICIIVAVISVVILHLLQYFNILLPYELWLQRGMPI